METHFVKADTVPRLLYSLCFNGTYDGGGELGDKNSVAALAFFENDVTGTAARSVPGGSRVFHGGWLLSEARPPCISFCVAYLYVRGMNAVVSIIDCCCCVLG